MNWISCLLPGLSKNLFCQDLVIWILQHFVLSIYSQKAVLSVNSALVFLINNLHFMGLLLAFPSQILQEIIHVECIYNLYMQNACIVISEWISLYIINLVSTLLYFLLTKSNMSAGFVFCCFGCQKTHFVKIWWHGSSSIFLVCLLPKCGVLVN